MGKACGFSNKVQRATHLVQRWKIFLNSSEVRIISHHGHTKNMRFLFESRVIINNPETLGQLNSNITQP